MLLSLFVATFSGCGGSVADGTALPPGTWQAMTHADHYEVFSLDPRSIRSDGNATSRPATARSSPRNDATTCHEFPILGRVAIDDAATRDKINAAVLAGMTSWDGLVSACAFQPRHAVRVKRGEDTFDVLICFECGDVQSFVNDDSGVFGHIKRGTPAVFNEVLAKADIATPED